MAKARKGGLAIAALCIAVLALGAAFWWGMRAKQTTVLTPKAIDGPLNNPLSGFAPSADYAEIVGDNTLVYVDVTWRELEPEQNRFDFAPIEKENHLAEWRIKGKRVVFRFVCDVPSDETHMDIPDWLYEATGKDGHWYDTKYGKGYSPNYANPIMVKQHRKAIEALGARYGRDDFFSFVELGSLGHWGEWHTRHDSGIDPLPGADVRQQYIEPYLESFPNAMILMRRPFREASENGLGLYNDMTGEPESTQEWLSWIQSGGEYNETGEQHALVPMADAWRTAPVGGEMTSSLTMEEMLQDNLEQTIGLIRQSHTTFLGPKCPVLPEEQMQFGEGIGAVLSALGSRLRVSRIELEQPLLVGSDLTVRLEWVNDGSAPFYRDWETVLYLLDSAGREAMRVPVDVAVSSIVDGTVVNTETVVLTDSLAKGEYTIALAMLDPDTRYPAYTFAMEGNRPDKLCILSNGLKSDIGKKYWIYLPIKCFFHIISGYIGTIQYHKLLL